MNKSALKTFATNARKELLKKVEAKAMKIGITEDNIKKADVESSDAIFIDGRQLSKEEKTQRDKLIARINQIGFKQVMEEVAYIWFNRFTALRFMEVNDYLPTGVRVLSSSNPNSADPDMLNEALELDLEIELDKEYIYELKLNNKTEELFKYLIIKHCNDMNRFLPFMFEKIDDYTEILFPEGLLAKDSFIRQMTDNENIPEDNWEKVEIIGWLYQYYISEKKDQVFADLKKNIKITKETLPSATQLFTPNWIVKYMVENSLGRIWMESYPESPLRDNWKYYLGEAEQEEEVINQIEQIRYKNVNPEEITFLDPCCGSGHILVYAFDVFYDMYLEKGYLEQEIPKLILEKNLFGLDIDDRAVQLASFALMMKAREKSRRVFRNEISLNIVAIQESNWMTNEMITQVSANNNHLKEAFVSIKETFLDAKEYGSILHVDSIPFTLLQNRLQEFHHQEADLVELIDKQIIEEKLPSLIAQSKILNNTYDVVCTNPPYMGSKGMNDKLSGFLRDNFPNTKSDLSTVLMEKSLSLCKPTGLISMINIPVWMFLTSYEELRKKIISNNTFLSMLHFGRGVFGSDFGTTAFVVSKFHINQYKGVYRKLFEKPGAVDTLEQKKKWFFENFGYYIANQENFTKIPGNPIAYWVSENLINVFVKGESLNNFGKPVEGIKTGNNDLFLRYWYEINQNTFSMRMIEGERNLAKWVPISKGGSYRKWYGNNEYVINWLNDGEEVNKYPGSTISNKSLFFSPALTWTYISAGKFSMRYLGEGYLYNNKGPACYFEDRETMFYVLGLNNSKIIEEVLVFLTSTVDYKPGNISKIPVILSKENEGTVVELVKENVLMTKKDWDSFEISWEFKKHPFLNKRHSKVESSFEEWEKATQLSYSRLKNNEEELNRIFIDVYGLHDEFTFDVEEKDVTIRKANLEREIKSFISYSIGCMFGRYSLNEEGLIYAGGIFNSSRYQTFTVDNDNILPILPGTYFEDDIVSRFIEFVKVTFGEETLSENLEFIANTLGKKKGETAKESIRRYFLNDFFKDHVQTYKKRPIYWLFTSGKQKAFNCLIYMHRYDKTTLSRIRTDYLHEYQIRLDAEKKDLLSIIDGDYSTKEISNAKKELKILDKKIEELKEYDELLHHMADMQIEIDLDEGVAVNYEKFKGLVAKI